MSQLETAARELTEVHQLARLQVGLQRILPRNAFYAHKFLQEHTTLKLESFADFRRLPFTSKRDLIADQLMHPPFGGNLTYPVGNYVRLHQTSSTTGHPLKILDTQETWDWWADCWNTVYEAAGVTRDDIVYLAFDFGPSIGFWAAYEGARSLGTLTVPGGGLDSVQRLRAMQEVGATVLVSTPSYALHLAEVARQHNINLSHLGIRVTIHTGEPGASIPATRQRIEQAWSAQTYDHAGMTEIGAFGFSCSERQGIHVNEGEFIAEVLNPTNGEQVRSGEIGELVLTNLGRWGYPALRYRTGNLVRNGGYSCPCGRSYLLLPGGVLGRADDMLVVRGVNVYPSALADILHSFPEVQEYRIIITRAGNMDEIALRVECPPELLSSLVEELHIALNLHIPVESVSPGSLPRFEMKAERIEDRRSHN
ncbi:MAG TPA: AMP-binding protein [Ktedonobacteraceae bacterium]